MTRGESGQGEEGEEGDLLGRSQQATSPVIPHNPRPASPDLCLHSAAPSIHVLLCSCWTMERSCRRRTTGDSLGLGLLLNTHGHSYIAAWHLYEREGLTVDRGVHGEGALSQTTLGKKWEAMGRLEARLSPGDVVVMADRNRTGRRCIRWKQLVRKRGVTVIWCAEGLWSGNDSHWWLLMFATILHVWEISEAEGGGRGRRLRGHLALAAAEGKVTSAPTLRWMRMGKGWRENEGVSEVAVEVVVAERKEAEREQEALFFVGRAPHNLRRRRLGIDHTL